MFGENACLKVVATLVLFKKRKGINAAVTLGKLLLPKDTNESIRRDLKLLDSTTFSHWHFCVKEQMTTQELSCLSAWEGAKAFSHLRLAPAI